MPEAMCGDMNDQWHPTYMGPLWGCLIPYVQDQGQDI